MLQESAAFHRMIKGLPGGDRYTTAKFGKCAGVLKEIESAIGAPLHQLSRTFFLECQPASDLDSGYCQWLGLERLREYNLEYQPVSFCTRAGFLIFGVAGDGAPLMLNCHSNEVHLICNGTMQETGLDPQFKGEELPFTKLNMDKCTDELWASTAAFMSFLATR